MTRCRDTGPPVLSGHDTVTTSADMTPNDRSGLRQVDPDRTWARHTGPVASRDDRPAIIAHRGASGHVRENTVEAFQLAVDMGADGIELDVRRTADGRLVVHHDAHLPDGRTIVETSADQLPPHVPDLATALEACAGAWVNLEIKNDQREPDFDPERRVADEVIALLSSRPDPAERWLVSSFDVVTIEAVRATGTGVPTAYLVRRVTDRAIDAAVAGGHRALHPREQDLDRDAVERAHRAGLGVNTWTCNDPERMIELIDWGVDGLCTDLPDLARRVLRSA